VLPTDLDGAVRQAGESAAYFCNGGGTRAIVSGAGAEHSAVAQQRHVIWSGAVRFSVPNPPPTPRLLPFLPFLSPPPLPRGQVELLVPDLEIKSDEGAQQLLWDTSRTFLESLKGHLDFENVSSIFPSPEYQHFSVGRSANVRAIFPDAGSAALLKNQWPDAPFAFSSLMDRKPVQEQDDVVVLITPEYQQLSVVESIGGMLATEDGLTRPLIMYNPRLVSGDVGVGSIPWQLYLDDPNEPGRYILLRQQGSKPNIDDIEDMYMAASGGGGPGAEEPSFIEQAIGVISSFNRFMQSLSK
ncbi:unnamed protein product, partial [Closterium sp. NIES-64]